MTEAQASILEKAKRGEPEAITDLLNRKLQPKGIMAKTSVKNNYFWIMLEAEKTPSQKQLVEFVRQAFTNLEVYAYATVKIYGKCINEEIPDWHEDLSITPKVVCIKSPEFTPMPVKATEANGYVLSNQIYDLINETCYQSLVRRDNLEDGSIHDIAKNYIEDLERDLRLDFDQFTIGVIDLVQTSKVQMESSKVRNIMSQLSTYEFNVVKSAIRDLENITGVILSTDFPESDDLKNFFKGITDSLSNNPNNKSAQGAIIGRTIGSLFDPVVGTAIGSFVGAWIGGQMQAEDFQEIFTKYEKVHSKLISEWGLFLKKVFRKLTSLIAEETSLRFLAYEAIEKSIDLFSKGVDYVTDEKNPNLQKALNFFDQATTINSGHYQTWNFKGFTLSELKIYEEAIKSYDKALEIKLDLDSAWNNRGNALISLGRNEEAIKSYDKALEIKPDLHFAWDNRGDALANLGRKEEAILSYNKTLEIRPDWHYAWNNRGNVLISLGRNEEAITSFGKVFQLNPDDPEIWGNLGIKFSNLGKYKEALAAFDKVLQFKSNDYLTWNLRGNVLLDLERNEEAIASYGKALKIKPDGQVAFYNNACAYSLQNQIELALKNL